MPAPHAVTAPLSLLRFLQDVEHVGSKGSLASVRAGFFRNYLYPQKLAIYATKHNLAKLEQSELVRPPLPTPFRDCCSPLPSPFPRCF